MSVQKIDITQKFNAPVAQVFATLAEHENLNQIFFPAKVTRLKDGTTSRNGVGSVRQIKLIPLPFTPVIEETNTVVIENELIEYRITSSGSPIKNHVGTLVFTALTPTTSQLHYTIEFEGRLPFIGEAIKVVLGFAVKQGLKKLKV